MSPSPTKESLSKNDGIKVSPEKGHDSGFALNLHTGYADIKSACGEQVDSRKKTAPTMCFGSSSRPHVNHNGANSPVRSLLPYIAIFVGTWK
jgi:hypothetical protein